MAGISEEDIKKVREANDLVAVVGDRVPVRQKGRDFWCCCPIHDEKTPSCKIDPHSQLWHCFGCGAGGDVFSFIMQVDNLDFPDAVRKLAERVNIQLTETSMSPVAKGHKARLQEVCKETAQFYHMQLMRGKDKGSETARAYLSNRGFGGTTPKKWTLGYAPGNGSLTKHLRAKGFIQKELIDANVALGGRGPIKDRFYGRIMFPIFDVQGQCIAFGGRIIGDGQPKYLNSQETPIFHKSEVLYGLDKAKAAMAISGIAIVVEGYTDVISLHEAGMENAVATLGTALTGQHIRVLSRHAKNRIIYLFDGDEAGQRAADRALGFIDENMTPEAGRSKVELAAVTLPEGLDPADFVKEKGIDALKLLCDNAQPLLKYGIDRRVSKYDLSSAEGRSRALNDALSILAPIKDSLLAKDYAVQIAGKVRAREDDVLRQLEKLELPRSYKGQETDGDKPQEVIQQPAQALSQVEISRRKFEREFLSLCTQNPEFGISSVEALAQTQWHDPVHSLLAQSILDTLAQSTTTVASDIVIRAQKVVPSAPSILTSNAVNSSGNVQKRLAFLIEELSLGDMEDAIAALKSQLKNPQSMNNEEYEMLFESVVAMQKEFTQRRSKHKPPS